MICGRCEETGPTTAITRMDCLVMKSWKRRARHLKEIRKSLRGGIRRIPGNLLQHRTGIRTAPMKFPRKRKIPVYNRVKQGSRFAWNAGILFNGIFGKSEIAKISDEFGADRCWFGECLPSERKQICLKFK